MNDPIARHLHAPLAEKTFSNGFVAALPGDTELRNVPRAVRNACYTPVTPTPVAAPRLLAWSEACGQLLGIARPDSATGVEAQVLGGNRVLEGMRPYAARYGGHQFGHWAGQLGDGRAISLADVKAPDGRLFELQLKGAGPTPYSRSADGRAVLRSSVREFLCSEAMFHLGIATTRALSLVGTGEPVVRDMFYDGNPADEPGAVVCRVAPCFVRFGNFEILAAQDEPDNLERLIRHVIQRHYPDIRLNERTIPESVAAWFEEICRRTALLVVDWMRVGFVHGVMNTDNMSILGVTIDYGPYGWLEGYDLQWTPNTTDAQGRRYCYGNQPAIAQWNLVRLAQSLLGPCPDKALLERGLDTFGRTFESGADAMLRGKLGLASLAHDGDDALVSDLLKLLSETETDMTIFFRNLARVPVDAASGDSEASAEALLAPLRNAFYDASAPDAEHGRQLAQWLRRYNARVRDEGLPAAERVAAMNRVNPKYVLRNYLAQTAIDSLVHDDASVIERLLRVLARPYDEQPEHEDLAARRPEWARHKAGCSALSCSS